MKYVLLVTHGNTPLIKFLYCVLIKLVESEESDQKCG